MTEKQTSKKTGLERLLEPFPANQINKLPKPYKKDSAMGKCSECGGYHGLPAIHLDFVGHAALTARLLEADLNWTWEPLALDEHGLPAFDKLGGLWIRLTVCGVTRLGYGDAQGKTGPNAIKESIGDALRNAGMRFGAALDLWHKGDLYEATVVRGDNEGVVIGKGEKPVIDRSVPEKPVYSEEDTNNASLAIDEVANYNDLESLKKFYESVPKLQNIPVGKTTLNAEVTKRVKALKEINGA